MEKEHLTPEQIAARNAGSDNDQISRDKIDLESKSGKKDKFGDFPDQKTPIDDETKRAFMEEQKNKNK